MEWRPIETAPKDGTEIMLSTPMLNRPIIGAWRSYLGEYWWSAIDDARASHEVDVNSYTHWMPLLPPPPRAEAAGNLAARAKLAAKQAGIVNSAVSVLRELPEELRTEVFAEFCTFCGRDDPLCKCMRDD